MLTSIKATLFGRSPEARRIPCGLYRDLIMELNLTSQLQLFLGLQERETHPWIRRWCADAATAIDVGAGTGELVLYFLRKTTIRRVYAFEPSDSTRSTLLRNLALNSYEQDGRVSLSGKFVASRNDQQHCTLDSLCADIQWPCFVKIDVDGSEIDVLRGSEKLLQSGRAVWLIETHSANLETECVKILASLGYVTRVIPNAWYRAFIPETRPIPHNRWLFAESRGRQRAVPRARE